MDNNNGKASVIVKDSEENEEKRQLVKGSSQSNDNKFDEGVDNENDEAKELWYSPRPSSNIRKATEGEQVAAGWPAWLSAVAAEAVKGWVPRTVESYMILDKIGYGSYSTVFRARDLMHDRTVALKKVWFDDLDPKSVRFMVREMLILRRLEHPNVIKLEGVVVLRSSSCLYLVLEYMEHDLDGLALTPNIKLTEPQVKCYTQQLLCGLEHCHNRGILHRDIKSSNILVNNDGLLKIADFGLSTFRSFHGIHRRIPLTSHVITLRYRPPELLLGATKYGVEVDLWSTGCVLGELYAGKPILAGNSEVEQLHKIFKLCGSPSEDYWRKFKLPHEKIFKPQHPHRQCLGETFKDFPAACIKLLEILLSLDPKRRGTASLALTSEFFTTQPFACDPSSLPKFPPNRKTGKEAIRPRAPVRFMRPNANLKQVLKEQARQIQEVAGQARLEKATMGEVVSGDVAQKREEHDHQVQGATRQAMLKKISVNKVRSQGMPATANPVDSNPLIVPSNDVGKMLEDRVYHWMNSTADETSALKITRVENGKSGKVQAREDGLIADKAVPRSSLVQSTIVDQMFEEHDRHIQESYRRTMLEKRRVGMISLKDAKSK